jgi:hypothetical protein
MAVEARSRAPPKVLEELPTHSGVLSVYIDTSPARVIGQGHPSVLSKRCQFLSTR